MTAMIAGELEASAWLRHRETVARFQGRAKLIGE
jgi:hypothetical protein